MLFDSFVKSVCKFYIWLTLETYFQFAKIKTILLHWSPYSFFPLPSLSTLATVSLYLPKSRTQKWPMTSLCLSLSQGPSILAGICRYTEKFSWLFCCFLRSPKYIHWSPNTPDIKLAPSEVAFSIAGYVLLSPEALCPDTPGLLSSLLGHFHSKTGHK